VIEYSPAPQTLASLMPCDYDGAASSQMLVSDIRTDSREVTPGTLFIALSGIQNDGEKYISQAVENGATAILVERGHVASVLNVEVPVLGVENLALRVPEIADRFFGFPSEALNVFGVTGTNGKSTIVSLIAQMAKGVDANAATIGTLGFGVIGGPVIETGMTTPDVVQCHRILAELRERGVDTVAMEVSSHGIDQKRIANIKFDVAILTNITRDHLDYHGSFEEYARVKRSYLSSEQCGAAVVNLDDQNGRELLVALDACGKSYLTYSLNRQEADIYAEIKERTDSGTALLIHFEKTQQEVFCPLVGEFNISNVLAAIAGCCANGADFQQVLACLGQLKAVSGRLQKVDVEFADTMPSVYIDYAHTPDALETVLKALRHHVAGKLWVVFGCGGDRDKGKRALMGEIAVTHADYVVVTSDNPRTEDPVAIIDDIRLGLADSDIAECIPSRELAISFAIGNGNVGDCILIAGKGHEDYQIIGAKKVAFCDYRVSKEALLARLHSGANVL